MAKVSLRIYNREIERFVEGGHIDEAIAHCRHILRTFPKHLETYRLLGKAYLESRRYADAVDIFGRLLMAVPDDFVAHVGLSIIRDEEGKLDDAIWHMERAFEVQSANGAIQGELQRLYGRRDGMEPPKVRMTRGALARIYVHGELYPQAISEIRSVLAEDPQRTDMQVLLAHSYFKSGQKTDATDICNQLLKRYAYCFDANRIMVDLLPATSGSVESTQIYRMHIAEMDPYTNFVTGSVFNTNDVPDASVNLERFEYAGEEVQMGQDWNNSSLGFASVPPLGGGTSMVDETPDWLRNSEAETPQTSAMPDSSSQASEELPDFLRAAGWGESNSPEQPTSIFDEEPGDGSLAQGDMPDWLKAQVPAEDQLSKASSSPVETPDYLTKLDSSFDPFADAMAPSMDNTAWLSGEAADDVASAQPAAATDLPDWLSSLGSGSQVDTPSSNAGSDDWLSNLGGVAATGAAIELSGDNDDQPLAEPADIPDWLKGSEATPQAQPAASVESLGASSQEQDDAVAWLESLAAKHGAKPEELVTDPNKRSETPPDWVAQAQTIGNTPASQLNAESLGASSQEQDDAVAWLESLAAKHGAKPEELVTDPNKRSETPPDWVAQAQTIGNASASQPNIDTLGSSSQEQDDAVAWLESLAAKHGAKPEELVTDPNKRSDTPPDWVAQAQTIGSQTPATSEPAPQKEWSETAQNVGEDFFAEFEKASTSEPAVDATGMWLRSHEDEKENTVAASDLPDWMKTDEEQELERGEIPEWLSDSPSSSAKEKSSDALPEWISEKEDASESSTFTLEEDIVKNQDLSDWLSGLDNEPGLDIDPNVLRAPQTPPIVDNSTQSVPAASSALPDWMSDVDAEDELEDDLWKQPIAPSQVEAPASAVETPAVSLSADLPDWLQNVDEEQNQNDASGDDGEDLPPWAHREQWEAEESSPSTPKPTSPADWQPVAAAPRKEAAPKETRAAQYPPSPEPNTSVQKKKAPAKQGLPRSRKPEAQGTVAMLSLAKSELDRGDIPEALSHYGKLIKKGKHLEEIIGELSESIYRYPVEVGIWQALGDAYMRANRLKEALESYNKAEELIR